MTTQVDNASAAVSILQQKAQMGDFSGDLNAAIMEGKVSLYPTSDYIATTISNKGGQIELVESNTKRVIGVSTYDGNSFDSNVAKIVDAIEVTVAKGDPANLGKLKFNQAAPAELLNAHLIIKQNSRLLLEQKVSDFIAEGTSTSADENYGALDLPLIFRDRENFEISLKFPEGAGLGDPATAADTLHAKVAFKSYATIRKA